MTVSRVILWVCVTWICICLCTCTRDRCVRARKGGSRLNVADGRFDGQGERKVSKVGQDVKARVREVLKWNGTKTHGDDVVDKKWGDVDRHGRACRLAESSGLFRRVTSSRGCPTSLWLLLRLRSSPFSRGRGKSVTRRKRSCREGRGGGEIRATTVVRLVIFVTWGAKNGQERI